MKDIYHFLCIVLLLFDVVYHEWGVSNRETIIYHGKYFLLNLIT
jgi:hypothetical protein